MAVVVVMVVVVAVLPMVLIVVKVAAVVAQVRTVWSGALSGLGVKEGCSSLTGTIAATHR